MTPITLSLRPDESMFVLQRAFLRSPSFSSSCLQHRFGLTAEAPKHFSLVAEQLDSCWIGMVLWNSHDVLHMLLDVELHGRDIALLFLRSLEFMGAAEAIKHAFASIKPVPPGSSPFAADSQFCQCSHLPCPPHSKHLDTFRPICLLTSFYMVDWFLMRPSHRIKWRSIMRVNFCVLIWFDCCQCFSVV